MFYIPFTVSNGSKYNSTCLCLLILMNYAKVAVFHVKLIVFFKISLGLKGPSIYDVHTEDEGVMLRWTHVDGGVGCPALCGRPDRKLKLESTDVILSFSHAKKLASFFTRISLWTEKKWKFFCDGN